MASNKIQLYCDDFEIIDIIMWKGSYINENRNRFLKYISLIPNLIIIPQQHLQLLVKKNSLNFLVEEMRILGLVNVHMSEYGVVYGTIPSNNDHQGDVIGFIAHMDTSPDASGENIHPQVIRDYDGKRITLHDDFILDPQEFTDLQKVIGHDLITTDGTTLLGADDKAGIAIIMSMAEYMFKHPEFKHNDIQIAFTPDEEVGRGTEHFDIETFHADYAYTIDGGDINEFYFENFNAYQVLVEITGKSIHPGSAKNKMINSLEVAQTFNQLLPIQQRPEFTEGYEGFNHLHDIHGSCERTVMEYIIP